MPEQKTVHDLIEVLKRTRMTDSYIIQTLASIIQSQMMYGGTLEEKIQCMIKKVEKEERKSNSHH